MKREQVLSFPKENIGCSFIKDFTRRKGSNERRELLSDLITVIARDFSFIERDIAETSDTHIHIIPYTSIESYEGDILLYKRKTGGKEERLHNQLSIGFGGHISSSDGFFLKEVVTSLKYSKPLEFIDQLIYFSALKELYEELNGLKSIKPDFQMLIYDPTSEVSRVHLGLMFHCSISKSEIEYIQTNEPDKIELELKTIDEVLSMDLSLFESWSRIYLESLKI